MWRGVSDGKAMAASVMDGGPAICDAGAQPIEAVPPGECVEIVVLDGLEDPFLTRGRIARGTLIRGDAFIRALRSCWKDARPEEGIVG